MVNNFYLQLQKFEIHDTYVIYCDNETTYNEVKKRLPKCETYIYRPSVPVPNELIDLLSIDDQTALNPLNKKYTYINFAKHDCILQYLKSHNQDYIIYLDADIVLYENPIPNAISLFTFRRAKGVASQNPIMAIKFYQNGLWAFDSEPVENIGNKIMPNCGFMVFPRHKDIVYIIQKYLSYMFSYPVSKKSGNVDEILFGMFLENNSYGTIPIPDHINSINDRWKIWSHKDMINFKSQSLHLTFLNHSEKIAFLKQSGSWYL